MNSCDQLYYYWYPQKLEDALKPSPACAAAKIGDIDALEILREMVRNWYLFRHLWKYTCIHALEQDLLGSGVL